MTAPTALGDALRAVAGYVPARCTCGTGVACRHHRDGGLTADEARDAREPLRKVRTIDPGGAL